MMMYDDAIVALKLAIGTYNKNETKEFLDECFLGIVELVTDQSSISQAKYIEETILRATEVMIKSFDTEPLRFLPALGVLLDKTRTYYFGQRSSYWAGSQPHGSHHVRSKMVENVGAAGGFQKVVSAMDASVAAGSSCTWLSARILQVLFTAAVEAKVEPAIATTLIKVGMNAMSAATDDQLKNMQADDVRDLLLVFHAWRSHQADGCGFRAGWLKFTQRLLSSTTLVLKLMGLNQARDLSLECKRGSPPKAFVVRGAGTEYVNGLYVGTMNEEKESPVYVKLGSEADDVPDLTIYRWEMSDPKGSQWWFIGEKDNGGNNTSKEHDYYQHKSVEADWPEPPARGWWMVTTDSHAKGVGPAPTLVRQMGSMGQSAGNFSMLVQGWARKHCILESVLGKNLHREVVARSTDLVVLLSDCDCLSEADLRLIWKAGFEQHDRDVMNEVFSLLGTVSPLLSDDLYITLLQLATQEVQKADREGLDKVGSFLAKIGDVTDESADALLQVVCEVFSHPYYESISNRKNVEQLLTLCLQSSSNRTQLTITYIKKFAGSFQRADGKSVREPDASRMVDILQYFIAEHTDQTVTEVLHEQNFGAFINGELMRYVRHARVVLDSLSPSVSPDERRTHTQAVCAQIRKRLKLLRFYFGKSNLVDMTYSELHDLWLFLVFPHERDEFMLFLAEAGPQDAGHSAHVGDAMTSSLSPAFSDQDSRAVFRHILCDPSADWTSLQDEGFSCLEAYFQLVCGHSHYGSYLYNSLNVAASDDALVDGDAKEVDAAVLQKTGVDMLWRVAVGCESSAIARRAMFAIVHHCKDAYKLRVDVDDSPSPLPPLIRRIGDDLKVCSDCVLAGNTLSTAQAIVAERCAQFLQLVVAQSVPSKRSAHITRGSMSKMRVTVSWRKPDPSSARNGSNGSYYNSMANQYDAPFSSSYNSTTYAEGTAELVVHPMQRMRELKAALALLMDYKSPRLLTLDLERRFPYYSDNDFICDYAISHGAQLNAMVTPLRNTRDDDLVQFCVSDFITDDASYFETLLVLCSELRSQLPTCALTLWNVLMAIPTSEIMLAAVRGGDGMAATVGPVARAVYAFQVMDYLLEPVEVPLGGDSDSDSDVDGVEDAAAFRTHFLALNGVDATLKFLLALPSSEGADKDSFCHAAEAVTLHILRHAFESAHETNGIAATSFVQGEAATQLVTRLLCTDVPSGEGASTQDTSCVHDAISLLRLLLGDVDMARVIYIAPAARALLVKVLTCPLEKVRRAGLELATEMGRDSPLVLDWLLTALDDMDVSELDSDELVVGVGVLSTLAHVSDAVRARLVVIMARVLGTFSDSDGGDDDGQVALSACLRLQAQLIIAAPDLVEKTEFGSEFVHNILSRYLLSIPTEQKAAGAICRSIDARDAAFESLLSCAQRSSAARLEIMNYVQDIVSKARISDPATGGGADAGQDLKRPDIELAGLKNQGCTCYMNSLLQQLYLMVDFREAVLRTQLKVKHRTTLWHVSNAGLVGAEILLEWEDGSWKPCKVVEALDSGEHRVEYGTGTEVEEAELDVRLGREGMETGRCKWLVDEPEEDRMTEADAAAMHVLEQLQRTFYFMKHGQGRYFDPRPFVEACKTLNLPFNVYQQNDAAEFFVQLLDRIETSTKGKYTGQNVWDTTLMKNIFGGSHLYQKVPTECERYDKDKTTCGHWQTSRTEDYQAVQMEMRGVATDLDGALGNYCKGEMMDGDNRIDCEVCSAKKDTVRRTCFDRLPNSLVLHLKRFDLDFQTFQTVKLNGRMAFPRRLNMYPYTRKGIEAADRATAALEASGASPGKSPARMGLRYEPEQGEEDDNDADGVDMEDYCYELQGVLVHSGVAQGGHYYSFIRGAREDTHTSSRADAQEDDQWYLFDDEDVSSFDASELEAQCFGGPQVSSHSGKVLEGDRSRNALMLFYAKVRRGSPSTSTAPSSPNSSAPNSKPTSPSTASGPVQQLTGSGMDRLVDGYEAFEREVQESNLRHVVVAHLCDPCLHRFLAQILLAMDPGDIRESSEEGVIFFHAANFFLENVVRYDRDVLIHDLWLRALQRIFRGSEVAAMWFVRECWNDRKISSFFATSLFEPLARQSFGQMLLFAMQKLTPRGPPTLLHDLLMAYHDTPKEEKASFQTQQPMFPVLWHMYTLQNFVIMSPNSKTRIHLEDCLALLRDLACIPVLGSYIMYNLEQSYKGVTMGTDGSYNADGEHTAHANDMCRYVKPDRFAQQAALEVIAATIGIPYTQRLSLINEHTRTLSPEAESAFTTIFGQYEAQGSMDMRALINYIAKTRNTKMGVAAIRAQFLRYGMKKDDRLPFRGFMRFYTDIALVDPNQVWRDLYSHDFDNELKRQGVSGAVLSATGASDASTQGSSAPVELSVSALRLLGDLNFYTETMTDCQVLSTRILQAVVMNSEDSAISLAQQALKLLCEETTAHESAMGPFAVEVLQTLRCILMTKTENQENIISVVVGDDMDWGLIRRYSEFAAMRQRAAGTAPPRDTYGRAIREADYKRDAKMLDYLRVLCEVPEVYAWIMDPVHLENPQVHTVAGRIQQPCATVHAPFSVDLLKGSSVIVEGAPDADADGIYATFSTNFDQSHKPHPGFAKRIIVDAATGDYKNVMVHRCRLKDGKHRWYISEIPKGGKPGEVTDIDKYETLSYFDPTMPITNDWTPPRTGWKAVGKGVPPTDMTVTWVPAQSGAVVDVVVVDDDDDDSDDDDDDDDDDGDDSFETSSGTGLSNSNSNSNLSLNSSTNGNDSGGSQDGLYT
jgi:ubiquitin C-terminal hydrolase